MIVSIIGCCISVFTCLMSIGAFVYKYSQVVSSVMNNQNKINELQKHIDKVEDNQKDYQIIITKSLDDIKISLGKMNTSIAILATKLELKSKDSEDDGK